MWARNVKDYHLDSLKNVGVSWHTKDSWESFVSKALLARPAHTSWLRLCYAIFGGPDQTKWAESTLAFVVEAADDWYMKVMPKKAEDQFHGTEGQVKITSIHKKTLLNNSRSRTCD